VGVVGGIRFIFVFIFVFVFVFVFFLAKFKVDIQKFNAVQEILTVTRDNNLNLASLAIREKEKLRK
jgi:hypothetical protein